MGMEYLFGRIYLFREDGFVVEGTWKKDELNGSVKIYFSKTELPEKGGSKSPATSILSYCGKMKDNHLSGEGEVV